MKITEFRLSKDDWDMLVGTDLGANMILHSFTLTLEVEEEEILFKCTDWLEEHATAMWYVSPNFPGAWTFYFNNVMDKSNLLHILTSPVE